MLYHFFVCTDLLLAGGAAALIKFNRVETDQKTVSLKTLKLLARLTQLPLFFLLSLECPIVYTHDVTIEAQQQLRGILPILRPS